MNKFILRIEASAAYSGGNAPTLEVLIGGVVVSSESVLAQTGSGTDVFTFYLEFTGSFPSSLEYRFNGSSGDPGDTVSLESIRVNGQAVNSGDLTAILLARGATSTQNMTNTDHLFGRVEPTQGDLGTPDVNGTAGDDGGLNGNNQANIIYGDAGADRIRGLGGDDAINGGDGADFIFGENGNDIIIGGAGDDILFGDSGDDLLYGQDGMDAILGGAGNDTINGGADGDWLMGDNGDDIIFGEDGDDTISGDNGNDLLFGDDGNDAIAGGSGDDVILGGNGNDSITGNAGLDEIYGEDGDDTVDGGAGNDTIDGGDGDDTLFGGAGDDTIAGGNDDDIVYGDDGNDTLDGNAGNDFISGGAGADTIDGGSGNDVLHGNGLSAAAISAVLHANPGILYSHETGSFYQFVNSSVTWDTARANALAATLNGVNGHLVNINSAAENDFIYQIGVANGADNTTGVGANRIWLGGTDVVVDQVWRWADGPEAGIQFSATSTATNNMYANWGTGQPNNSGGAQDYATIWFNGGADDPRWDDRNPTDTHDYVIEWEGGLFSDNNAADILSGGAGNDWLYGWGGNDTLNGGADNDVLFGGAGNDILNGDDGIDLLSGGAGADTIDGGNGNDIINLSNGDFAAGESIAGGAGTDTIVLLNATTVDFTTGTLATVETLTGSAGNDTVTMLINHATTGGMFGTINFGAGTDSLNLAVSGSVNITGATLSTFTGVENISITGTGGNDTLTATGTLLNNIITGAGIIDFGGGTDTLILNATSTDLNTLGGTDASIQGLENISFSSAAAGITINLSAQTEGFTVTGSAHADTVTLGGGNDTFNIANNDYDAGESINGGGGTDEIVLTNATTVDFTIGTLTSIETLTGSSGADTVTLSAAQWAGFGNIALAGGSDTVNVIASGNISALGTPATNSVETGNLVGTGGNDTITLSGGQLNAILIGAGTINLGAGASDTINLTSTSTDLNSLGDAALLGVEFISAASAGAGVAIGLSGQSEGFTITGSTSADTIVGGNGNDTINLANGDFAAGETLTGNGGTDAIVLTNATTVDFSTGTLSTIETLTGSGSNDTVTMTAASIAGMFTTVNLGGGAADTLNILAAGNISAATIAAISNVEIGNLIGTAGNDTVTMTGAQLNAILIGTGTINLGGGGNDTIVLTSTSTDLNGLGDAAIQGVENISFASAVASITVNLSSQSEAFTITGSANADTITGGSGNDTINLANGDFAAGETINGGAGGNRIVLTNATTVDFTTGTVSNIATLTGSTGNDTVTMLLTQATGTFSTINLAAGGSDVLNLLVSGTLDISASSLATISNVESGNLTGSGGDDTLTLTGAQLSSIIVGSGSINMGAGTDTLNFNATSAALNTLGATDASIQGLEAISFAAAAAGVTLSLAGQTEGFTVTGSNFADTITTGAGADIIISGTGADNVNTGDGDDIIALLNGDFTTSESINGGIGNDSLLLVGTTVDFSSGTLTSIENMYGNIFAATAEVVTLSGTQWSGFTLIDLLNGSDTLNVLAAGDISALGTPSTISNIEVGNLVGTGNNDTITLTGTQLDAIIIGSGTINLGAGAADTINLTSTSADLNTLGNTDASIQGVENISASTAGAGVTISVYSQTEGFTITGSGYNDVILGAQGNTVIDGGAGADVILSGSVNTIQTAINAILAANSGVSYDTTTGNFYKYVSGTTTQGSAITASHATLSGGGATQGHLVHITSSYENGMIDTLTGSANVWMGGEDSGTNQWTWFDGVLDGIQFWSGTSSGSSVNSFYESWGGSDPGTDNAMVFNNGGNWADSKNNGGTKFGYVIEWEGSSILAPTASTTIKGGDGADSLYGGAGQDIFVFEAATAFNNRDTIGFGSGAPTTNYNIANLDKIDISDLLTGYTPGTSDDDLFARFVTSGGNDLILQVDRDGSGGSYSFADVALLKEVGTSSGLNLNIEELVAKGLLVMS